uniref:Uncharacterized protein n=1 Tax=Nelumbo nucifera TaxID=4432 RepID=A0A822XML9_NELNU|nr:TPA_asm: hypothetical protein HUJ06_021478 [Nelumbo nucifera]
MVPSHLIFHLSFVSNSHISQINHTSFNTKGTPAFSIYLILLSFDHLKQHGFPTILLQSILPSEIVNPKCINACKKHVQDSQPLTSCIDCGPPLRRAINHFDP